jgi:excisionase family DNA binding protein
MMNELLTSQDLADKLRVSVSTIKAWRKQGKIPAPLSLSRKSLRWSQADIDAWIAAGMPCLLEWELTLTTNQTPYGGHVYA